MKKHTMAILVLTAALTAAISANAQESGVSRNAVLENIATRTSVRSYTDKPVESVKIEQLLRAGMAAPTAVNRQPWHFVVVNDKAQLAALAETNPYSKMLTKAPLAIVVCGDMKKALDGPAREFWVQDCSAATENILLAAHSMGLGAVWTGTYPDKERCKDVAEVLKLPENLIPLNIIVIGYPDKENKPKDKWKPENISYNVYGEQLTDEQQVQEKEAISESDFISFDPAKEFNANAFTWFKGAGLLLASGDKKNHNAMTIGWGALGNIWQHDISTITVYVAPARYTYEFMEKYQYFTVMVFDEDRKDVLEYMGTHSGRDVNKEEALGLHVAYTEHGTPYYLEAREVYECEIMYRAQFNKEGFGEVPQRRYSNFPAGVHHEYIGKIVTARKR